MSTDNSGANFMVGLLIGAAMGAMGALLLAPKSGKELRADLREGGQKLKERAVDESRAVRDQLKETAEDIQERGRRVVDTTKAGGGEAIDAVKKTAKGVQSIVTNG